MTGTNLVLFIKRSTSEYAGKELSVIAERSEAVSRQLHLS
jgi:hypothetical protein